MDKNKIKKYIGLTLTILGLVAMVYAYLTTDDLNDVLPGLMMSSAGMLLSQSVKTD